MQAHLARLGIVYIPSNRTIINIAAMQHSTVALFNILLMFILSPIKNPAKSEHNTDSGNTPIMIISVQNAPP